ncbi:MAG: pilin [bacterium]
MLHRDISKKNIKPKSWLKKTAAFLIVAGVFFVVRNALAQPNLGINSLAEGGVQLAQTDIRVIVARIIEVFLGLLGTVAVVLIIYAGWQWMSSAGDAAKIVSAKKTLINAIIGLAIILSAFGITQFIVSRLISATSGGAPEGGVGVYGQPFSGSLGAGIVESHAPDRGATAFRNTRVAITFKEAIDERTLINDTNGDGIFGNANDEVNLNGFKMVKTATLKQNNNNFKNVNNADLVSAIVKFTPDKKNFVFSPKALLGDATEPTSYTVFLTANIKKADGTNAFSGSFGSGYQWEFQVDPVVDNTPPKLDSIIPEKGLNPRNTIVQLNFSEGLDPTSASGDTASGGGGFQNIILKNGAVILGGSYKISNGYRTVEFTTRDLCGTNSCGGEIYCLPVSSVIAGLVKAAAVGTDPPQATGFPYNGIVDLAGNSFDGNGNGAATGPSEQSGKPAYDWIGGTASAQGDDVAWQFNTTDQIDLVPPKINAIEPGLSAENVGLDAPVQITFSKIMSAGALNNSNLAILHDVPAPYEMSYSVYAEALDQNSQPLAKGAIPAQTKAIIKHGSFVPSKAGGTQYNYFPSVNSKVRDLRQNCYNPSAGPSCTPTQAAPYCCNGAASAVKCNYVP